MLKQFRGAGSFRSLLIFLGLVAITLADCTGDKADKMAAGQNACRLDQPGRPTGSAGRLIASGPGGTIVTIAGTGDKATDPVDGDGDGVVDAPVPVEKARFDSPLDTALGPDGRLYIMDWNGHKVRALDSSHCITFVAGSGFEGDACERPDPDGTCPAAWAELNHMTDVAFDPDGQMVLAAWHNSKIKRVDLRKKVLKDICGTGNRKFEGDGGPCKAADGTDLVSFDLPSGLAYDAAGHLFVSDQANQVIRRMGRDGVIKTVAGHCPGTPGFGCPGGQGFSGDGGPATSARLNNELGQGTDPQGKIAMDAMGNLYIADTGNHVIRKVVPGSDGIIGQGDSREETIRTIAGTGLAGYSGDGGPATEAMLSEPRDVEVGPDGGIYIADTGNNCIRKVESSGVIMTVAGRCGQPGGFAGDGGPAKLSVLNSPYGVELDREGNLYIADTFNNRIRVVYK
jgi:adhesin/invasin